ncbi:hypothetical protein NMG60_11035979 [Bertholletia excelsa]
MGAGRKAQTFILDESVPFSPNQATGVINNRNLSKSHLGGVIFGCKNITMHECLSKQLFGLPGQHFAYVKNINPGLPLFLFNYSDRKIHGIFESASSGQMNIDPYAWTACGSDRTPYPAQVQIRVRLQCRPLSEEQFKPIIIDNYYSQNHFWYELDHTQTTKLCSLLASLAVAPGSFAPQNVTKRKTPFQSWPSHDRGETNEGFKPPVLEFDSHCSRKSDVLVSSDIMLCLNGINHPVEDNIDKQIMEKGEIGLVYMKLKELALSRQQSDSPLRVMEDSVPTNDVQSLEKNTSDGQMSSEEKNRESLVSLPDPSVIAQLIQGMEELKASKIEQAQKMCCLEQKLADAEIEIQELKRRCKMLESTSCPSVAQDEVESFNDLELDPDGLIFLAGGYNGVSWLSTLDSYSAKHDMIQSLTPMNSIRSYASIAKLNGELYIYGGGNGGQFWYETVESYDPVNNQWTQRPSLNVKKGSLAGATLNDKIFAVGGGNGVDIFADVEMLDLNVGRWIPARSMLEKRFSLAAAELNGALYALGGFDGMDYLKSAERFDPREHSWNKIKDMDTKRGCHSVAVLNEKIYAIGGFDGSAMVPSIEIFDPRLDHWMPGQSMAHSRGYSAAVVLNGSMYVIGGVISEDNILDTVECYKEGQGWHLTNLKAIGRRGFFSAIVL